MAQPDFALSFTDLQTEVGFFLGYGRTAANWSTDQTDVVAMCIKGGLNRFYAPPALPGEPVAHRWSFLRPKYSFDTTASDFDYDLPDDFGQVVGPIHFDNSEKQFHRIRIVPESVIMAKRQISTQASSPQYAAIRSKSVSAGSYQVYELLLYPTPDAVYTLHFRYALLPNKLSSTNTYPYGGAVHSETLLESCLSVAEERVNDERGMHYVAFMERLKASVDYDRRVFGSQLVGYNGDASDGSQQVENPRDGVYVTYDGVLP